LKIGLAVGSGLVTVAALWLATRPSLTPKGRLEHLHDTDTRKESVASPQTPVRSEGPRRASATRQPANLPVPSTRASNNGSGSDVQRSSNVAGSTPRQSPAPSSPSATSTQADVTRQADHGEQTEPIKTETFYIVRKGDTLSGISYKYYGSASKWPKIFEANRETISDANKLTPGTKLIIPN